MTIATATPENATATVTRPKSTDPWDGLAVGKRVQIIVNWLSPFLVDDDRIVECRALEVSNNGGRYKYIEAGYFDRAHIPDMARHALRLENKAVGVYFTLNPLVPAILSRLANKMDAAKETAADQHVTRRAFMLVDADPKRPGNLKIPATNSEKAYAFETTMKIREYLRSRGWPESILADSANGYHQLPRIELPKDDDGLVKRALQAIASRFNSDHVEIDCAVFNPARITKLYGTLARKADNLPDRPHRRSMILEVPGCESPLDTSDAAIEVVPTELIRELAAEAPDEKKPPTVRGGVGSANGSVNSTSTNGNGAYTSRLDVSRWLSDCGREFRIKAEPDSLGRAKFILKQCPFNADHGDPDSCIMQAADGQMSAQCFHNSCQGRGWQEFKEAIGKPESRHYDPPLPPLPRRRPAAASSPAPSGNAATESCSPEADNDPHRLARIYYAQHASTDGSTLRYWQGEWRRWDDAVYQKVDEKELRPELTACVKEEFDAIANAKLATYEYFQQKKKDDADEEKEKKFERPETMKVTAALIANVTQALSSFALLRSTVQQPAWLTDDKWTAPFPANEAVAFPNGILHLPALAANRTGTSLLSPTPRFFSENVMDFAFDPAATEAREWLAFLHHVWPDDAEAINTLQEWFGYSLLPDTRQQKILLVVGPKRSGKGTIARILRALVGIQNTVAPTLASLGTQFGLWPFLGKTLAVISDARLSGRTDIAVVTERLLSISGEDPQTIDRKNLSPVTCKLPVRFMILTNELPRLNDPSGALVGRLIILRQTESWYGKEDTTLTDRLLGELPGIFLWAVEGWRRLAARGHFLQPQSARSIVSDMEDLSSPIGEFVRERCVVGKGWEVDVQDLYGVWKHWCEGKGFKSPGTDSVFGRDLRSLIPAIERVQRGKGSDRYRVYVGIRLRDASDVSGKDDDWDTGKHQCPTNGNLSPNGPYQFGV